jgi:hypothetical protein
MALSALTIRQLRHPVAGKRHGSFRNAALASHGSGPAQRTDQAAGGDPDDIHVSLCTHQRFEPGNHRGPAVVGTREGGWPVASRANVARLAKPHADDASAPNTEKMSCAM